MALYGVGGGGGWGRGKREGGAGGLYNVIFIIVCLLYARRSAPVQLPADYNSGTCPYYVSVSPVALGLSMGRVVVGGGGRGGGGR